MFIEAMSLPSNWDLVPPCQNTVQLSPVSREYQDVALKFQQTAGSVAIASIERIQNPHLYQAYQLRKVKMDNDNGGNNERQLFHGTNPDRVLKINTQGFKSSFAGSANGENSDKLSDNKQMLVLRIGHVRQNSNRLRARPLRSHFLCRHATLLPTQALRDLHITPVKGTNSEAIEQNCTLCISFVCLHED